MKPYYQDDSVTLYHGDCREIVPTLGKFDLLLTDPPFGVGNFVQISGNLRGKGEQIGKAVTWNESPPDASVFKMLQQSAKKRIIWGANYFNCFDGNFGAIIWLKKQLLPNLSKAEVASCSFYKKTEVVEIGWTNFKTALFRESTHPCERPITLYTWCIEYAGTVETILDPFAGSGSVGRAAKDLGRKCTMIEIEERYCEIAAKRMAQEVLAL